MKVIKNSLFIGLVLAFQLSIAQEVVTLEQAVTALLQSNYGIVISSNSVEIAKNNSSTLNSGYLPTVTGNAGAVYNVNNVEAVLQNGSVTNLTAAKSRSYNAGVNVNYTLFDGMGRKYNFDRLKETYQLTELQARETVELTMIELFGVYFNIARLTENIKSLEQSMQISQERLTRSKSQLEYGQGSNLDVLNAEVDINSDSINYFTLKQELSNAKHNLNLMLGRDIRMEFVTDTAVSFITTLQETTLYESMLANNVNVMQIEKELEISTLNYKSNKSDYLPIIGVNASYGWNKNYNNKASFLISSSSIGFSGGASLTWNLFDGGRTKTAVQNSKIAIESQEVVKEKISKELERDFINAWGTYQNRLFIYNTQLKNFKTAQANFERTQERSKVGRVNSVEFRQAQLNLLNMEVNTTFAKYDAKIAELKVVQVSGQLLEVGF